MRKIFCIFSLMMLLCLCGVANAQQSLSPLDYGWREAKSDVERWKVLMRVHNQAVKKGVDVDYTGLGTINIEMGDMCAVIPLTDTNDFKGTVINARSSNMNDFIFRYKGEPKTVSVTKKQIDSGDFTRVPELAKGEYMLIIKDKNAWGERHGYSEIVTRKEVLHIKNGKALNTVVMPYNNKESDPECTYVAVRNKPLVIKNVTVNRKDDSDKKVYAFDVQNTDNVVMQNITINTTNKDKIADQAIRVYNCMNVTMSDISINGTYSLAKKYGYGISLDNVYNYTAQRIYGRAAWGVYCVKNINTAVLEDCDVNRWDTHHYGKDIIARRCAFTGLVNAMSSVYGEVRYDTCRFVNHVPLAIRGEYYAHVPVTVTLNGCTVHSDKGDTQLGSVSMSDDKVSTRKELKTHHVPTVILQNTTFSTGSPTTAKSTIEYRKITSLNTINSKVSAFINK